MLAAGVQFRVLNTEIDISNMHTKEVPTQQMVEARLANSQELGMRRRSQLTFHIKPPHIFQFAIQQEAEESTETLNSLFSSLTLELLDLFVKSLLV